MLAECINKGEDGGRSGREGERAQGTEGKNQQGLRRLPFIPQPSTPKGLSKCIRDNPKTTAKAASQEAAQQEVCVGQALEHWSVQSLGDQLGERGPSPAWWVIGRSWGVLLADGKTAIS